MPGARPHPLSSCRTQLRTSPSRRASRQVQLEREQERDSRVDAVARGNQSLALFGHGEDRWSVVLHAQLSRALDAGQVADRVSAGVLPRPELGPPPPVQVMSPQDLPAGLRALAGVPYRTGGPALRVSLVGDPDPGVAVAAHHGVLDGLGLLALLSLVLGHG